MRLGLVGYGVGGRCFHAPFIMAATGVELVGIVARADKTIAAIKADFPAIPIYASLTQMLAAGVDIVTITTPPQTREALVLEAANAGVHVIADKPFAPDAQGARVLQKAALDNGITLGVFHNRRYDTDLQTLKKLIDSDRLGKIWRVHSCMDFNDPITIEAGESGGVLRDLGSHLIDQMLWLLGPVTSVNAQLDYVKLAAGNTVAGFTLTLIHSNGVHSHLSASKLNCIEQRELRVYAQKGYYVSNYTDVQAQAIFSGKKPAMDLDNWGIELEENWGTLSTATGMQKIPSEQGRYHDYYSQFAEAVMSGGQPPVSAEEAIATLEVIDAAYRSAKTAETIKL
ncbi:MAG: Gfo/Idh/MocA family oxidoreductase [Oceanospirillaceae bacterium]|nr:Gfo/Idh/MocA family oxidoreductase [Oceanospirillaceae bacterium]